MTRRRSILLAAALARLSSGCGYRLAGRADLMPKSVHSIAISPFGNGTMSFALARVLPQYLTQEFHARTRYSIVTDEGEADAVLAGSVVSMAIYPSVSDPQSGRATADQIEVLLNLSLTERRSGAVLYSATRARFRERYEVALDPKAYFDERGSAVLRIGRDVARDVVSNILEKF
jgi:hypothetical protein